MTTTLILYTGSFEASEIACQQLTLWSKTHPHVNIRRQSVHDDPVAVVRLGITDLPALVLNNEVIAQGPPEYWLTDEFLHDLASRIEG